MARKKYMPMIIGAAILVVLIIILSLVLGGNSKTKITDDNLAQGVSYLQGLEAKDPTDVDKQIKLIRQQRIQAMKDELKSDLLSGKTSVWSMFDDYIVMGDSRTIGFSYYGFLPESNVWAETGATILNMEAMLPELLAAAPSYVYVTYGMNDFCSALWATPADFAADYADLIRQIHTALPDTKVIVCSILPATEAAYARANIWSVIPNWNEAIREMCDSLDNCYYVDCDAVAAEYESLYESDGVHFNKEFYPYWATTIIMEQYNIEYFMEEEEDTAA